MGDFVVAAVIAAVGLLVVIREELAHRGLLPYQKKNAPAAATAEAEDK